MKDIATALPAFQRIESNAAARTDTRAMIRDNIMPLYVHNQQQEQTAPEGITALYERLSQEDKLEGESNSIANQKKILERYCKEHGYTGIRHYEDDGYSGTNFQRPSFQSMLADVKAGKISRVIVKDMSRFGRDYLQVGMYTDILFPNLGVHFVAVNDGVDSTRGDNEFTAIRNVFNEMYARDTSKKILATWQSKGKSGEHLCTIPPYGYAKDPDNKKSWVIDEEAAAVVQKIFALCVDGLGPSQIANWLRAHQILSPSAYWLEKGVQTPTTPPKDPCRWAVKTIAVILERMDYLGHTVNFKTRKPSYKSKKILMNEPTEWAVFENTQEPIVEESVFLIVQNLRQGKRRPTKQGAANMLSGLLFCADCGGKMYQYRGTHIEKRQEHFVCSTYHNDHAECSTHTIRNVVLEEIILRNLREAIAYVARDEAAFVSEASNTGMRERDKERTKKQDTLAQNEKRIAELDLIIKRLYEDNVTGKLSDERFVKLSREYEQEQGNLKAAADALRKDLKIQEKQKSNVKHFIAATKKYTDLQELNATVLREFIDRINVSAMDRKSKTRDIEIVYNFIGAFDFQTVAEQSENMSTAQA
jgi:DNA invertase Pin-like site-specific DNA recombinase